MAWGWGFYHELNSGEERGRGAAAEGGSMGGEAPEEGNMETDSIENSEIHNSFDILKTNYI